MTDYKLPRPPKATPLLYAQDGQGYGAIVHAHYLLGASDWLVTEYDPDADLAFGWACLNGDRQNAELGYTSVAELEQLRQPVSIVLEGVVVARGDARVELEDDWTPMPIHQAIQLLDQRHGRAYDAGGR